MLVTVRDRVQNLRSTGRTVEEMIATNPTASRKACRLQDVEPLAQQGFVLRSSSFGPGAESPWALGENRDGSAADALSL